MTSPRVSAIPMRSLALLVVSGLGVLVFLASAAGLAVTGLFATAAQGLAGSQATPLFSLAWASFFFTLLLIPSLVNALIQILGLHRPPLAFPHQLRLATFLMFFYPALVFLGDFVSVQDKIAWLLLPPLQIAVTVIPVLWLFEIGRSGLALRRPQRAWGWVSYNLVVNQPLIMVAELFLILFLGLLVLIWLTGQPELVAGLERLAQRIIDTGMDPEMVQKILSPYLSQPWVITSVLLLTAGLIPFLEELLKPLILWAGGRTITPQEGFVGGMLCGATFAIMETITSLSTPLEFWAAVVVARFGTILLHITASGLVGWGIASALSARRWARLGAVYLLSVTLHSLWNVFGTLMGVTPLMTAPLSSAFVGAAQRLGKVAPAALGVLVLVMFLILVGSNRRLRRLPTETAGGNTLQSLPGQSQIPPGTLEENSSLQ